MKLIDMKFIKFVLTKCQSKMSYYYVILMYFDTLKPNPMFKLLHIIIFYNIDEK